MEKLTMSILDHVAICEGWFSFHDEQFKERWFEFVFRDDDFSEVEIRFKNDTDSVLMDNEQFLNKANDLLCTLINDIIEKLQNESRSQAIQ